MRMVVQRVSEASVAVDGDVVGRIGTGLVILLGIGAEDQSSDIEWGAKKVAELRIFQDDENRMNRSLLEIGGDALVISQFTLYGDVQKGRRPSFAEAAAPDIAESLYTQFITNLRSRGITTQTGIFAARMSVSLINEGPVTILLEH